MTSNSALDHSYDDIPYPDLCYAYTHPGRLAAVARLLGMEPAPVHECRVLEIGCAGGANLIPMAFSLPDSSFVGLDLSKRQIGAARAFAGDLGLRNVQFHAMDLMDVTSEFGTFEYIIAHGVYSWVPREVRDKVLAICRRHLSPMGVGYVSYNTLPGWHLMLTVREMMLYHTRNITEPHEVARHARQLIITLRSMVPDADQSVFASFLDAYVETRFGHFAGHDAWEDSAFLHDELSAINEPVYFHQFMDHAQQHHLHYLADATFPQSMTNGLSTDTIARLREMAPDTIEFEQHLDYVRQQSFRRTLLCHEDVDIRPTPRAGDVRDLYVTSRAQLVDDDNGNECFRSNDGSTFPAEHPVTTAALAYLGEVSPQAIHFPALMAEACARAGTSGLDEATAERLATDLLDAATRSNQQAELLTYDPVLTALPSERPLASPIARLQTHRSRVVSNLRHEQVPLNGLSRALVPLLDGRHTRDELLRGLLSMVDEGRLSSSPQSEISPEQIEQELADDIDHTLGWLGRAAILLE